MKGFIKWMDNLSRLGKIIFCLPILDIVWAIYRICKGVVYKKPANLVLGIVWVFVGSTILWVLDLVCIVLYNHIFLADK